MKFERSRSTLIFQEFRHFFGSKSAFSNAYNSKCDSRSIVLFSTVQFKHVTHLIRVSECWENLRIRQCRRLNIVLYELSTLCNICNFQRNALKFSAKLFLKISNKIAISKFRFLVPFALAKKSTISRHPVVEFFLDLPYP